MQTRESKLSLSLIAENFCFPLAIAAENIGIGIATLKRACRSYGIVRWPYRKLRALRSRKEILKKGGHLTPSSAQLMQNCLMTIEELRTSVLSEIRSVPSVDELCQKLISEPVHVGSFGGSCCASERPMHAADSNIRTIVFHKFLPM